jgi:hypothetical protein
MRDLRFSSLAQAELFAAELNRCAAEDGNDAIYEFASANDSPGSPVRHWTEELELNVAHGENRGYINPHYTVGELAEKAGFNEWTWVGGDVRWEYKPGDVRFALKDGTLYFAHGGGFENPAKYGTPKWEPFEKACPEIMKSALSWAQKVARNSSPYCFNKASAETRETMQTLIRILKARELIKFGFSISEDTVIQENSFSTADEHDDNEEWRGFPSPM